MIIVLELACGNDRLNRSERSPGIAMPSPGPAQSRLHGTAGGMIRYNQNGHSSELSHKNQCDAGNINTRPQLSTCAWPARRLQAAAIWLPEIVAELLHGPDLAHHGTSGCFILPCTSTRPAVHPAVARMQTWQRLGTPYGQLAYP